MPRKTVAGDREINSSADGVSKGLKDVQELVRNEMQGLDPDASDEGFVPDDVVHHRKVRQIKQDAEEVIIDELLAGVPQDQGYYLKLYKEIGPNKYQLKQRIDDFFDWADLEWEVTQIVRQQTKKNPSRWGSAPYKIVVWREGGIRTKEFRPVFLDIDAEEPEGPAFPGQASPVDPGVNMENQLAAFSNMMGALKGIMPPGQDPAAIQQILADAFKSGLSVNPPKSPDPNTDQNNMMAPMFSGMFGILAEMIKSNSSQKGDSGASSVEILRQAQENFQAMMTQVMSKQDQSNNGNQYQTGFSQAMELVKQMNAQSASTSHPTTFEIMKQMKDLGLMGPSSTNVNQSQSMFETIKQMKDLGLWQKSEDGGTIKQISDLKNLLGVVREILPTSDGASLTFGEKLLDKLIPYVPDAISKVSDVVSNVIELNKVKLAKASQQQAVKRIQNDMQHNDQGDLIENTSENQKMAFKAGQRGSPPVFSPYDEESGSPSVSFPSAPSTYVEHPNAEFQQPLTPSTPLSPSLPSHTINPASGPASSLASEAESEPEFINTESSVESPIESSIESPVEPPVTPEGFSKEEQESMIAIKSGFQNMYKLIASFNPLEDAYITDNRCQAILDIVTPTLNLTNIDLVQGVGTDEISKAQVLKMMQQFGGDSFKSSAFISRFDQFYPKFDAYLKDIYSKLSSYVPVKCDKCDAEYDIDPVDFGQSDDNTCGAQTDDGEYCTGILEPVTN